MYTTLLFDIDDTLLDFKKTEKYAILGTLKSYDMEPMDQVVKDYAEINRNLWELYQKGGIEKSRLVVKRFEELFEKYGISADAAEANQKYLENNANGWFLLDGAKETLETLSKKYETYAVTNALLWVSTKRIEGSGLRPYFKKVFNSDEIGASKPNKEFFDVVFANINETDKSKILIIGDSLSSDILGGVNAGIDTCWVNPDGLTTDLNVTMEVKSVTELLNIL